MDKRCRNAFDTLCMSEEKKEQVFEDICEKCEKRKTHRFPKIAVAACILAVAVPTVGIAGEKISAYVMSLKKDGDRVFIAGSLYLVGEIKRIAGTLEEG